MNYWTNEQEAVARFDDKLDDIKRMVASNSAKLDMLAYKLGVVPFAVGETVYNKMLHYSAVVMVYNDTFTKFKDAMDIWHSIGEYSALG